MNILFLQGKESFSTMDSVAIYLLWWFFFLFLGNVKLYVFKYWATFFQSTSDQTISRSTFFFFLYQGHSSLTVWHRIPTFLIEQHRAISLGTALTWLTLAQWMRTVLLASVNEYFHKQQPEELGHSVSNSLLLFSYFKNIIWKEKVCLELRWEQRSAAAGGDLSCSLGVHLSSDYLFPPPSLPPSPVHPCNVWPWLSHLSPLHVGLLLYFPLR